MYGVRTHPGKSRNLRKQFSRPGKLWKMTVVKEIHGIPPIAHGIIKQKDNYFRSLTNKLKHSKTKYNI